MRSFNHPRCAPTSRITRASADTGELLPHWSDAGARRDRDGVRPTRAIATQLASLVIWASDLALRVAHDHRAIEHVRHYALAWLDGKPCSDAPFTDLVASGKMLLQAIERRACDAVRSTGSVTAQLGDLVDWAADLAVRLTEHCPEDREAIEHVRRYALSWLAGEPCRKIDLQDVLTTVATLLASLDLGLERRKRDEADPAPIAA